MSQSEQQKKAKAFRQLHYSDTMLVLPNVWDTLSAKLIEELKYPAIATASAAIAYSNNYLDGEKFPLKYFLQLLSKIVKIVNIPVTADIESAYAKSNKQLKENMVRFISTGIVGINIEDTEKETAQLLPLEDQCEKIKIIREVAKDMNIPLFINARIDVYIHNNEVNTTDAKLEETLRRGRAYKEAGADCIFPIAIRKVEDIQTLVSELSMPINVLTVPGIPELEVLKKIGVTRVSLGPSLLKYALQAMRDLAEGLKKLEGLSQITSNKVTSEYIEKLFLKDLKT